jgi:purine-binding chemotaxis protein CheW
MATTLTLIFTLGDEYYGIEIDAVQEIIENPALHFVPRAAGVIRGAVNFHGQILAAVDLPELLGYRGEERDHRQVVLTGEYKSLALAVTTIQRIAELDLAALQPTASEQHGAVRGVAMFEKCQINMLDTGQVLRHLEKLYPQ